MTACALVHAITSHTVFSLFCIAFAYFTSHVFFYSQFQFVTPLIFDWKEVGIIWRVEWRCASRDSGGQCVMTTGIPVMQWLPVDSSDSLQNVNHKLSLQMMTICSLL